MRPLALLFKTLSDETRLQMLGLLLQEGELCVCDFVAVLAITQSKASRHLRHLVNAGLLQDRRAGTWVYFRVTETPDPAQAQLLQALPALLEKRLPETLFARLKTWRESRERADQSCASAAASQSHCSPNGAQP